MRYKAYTKYNFHYCQADVTMNSKSSLQQQQELRQLQRLTPMQVQFVRMLEMTGPELEVEVNRALDEMPALEISESPIVSSDNEEFSETAEQVQLADYSNDDEIPSYMLDARNHSVNDTYYTPIAVNDELTLGEELMRQLSEMSLSEKQIIISNYIIGNLDSNGYLKRTVEAIADDITFTESVETEPSDVAKVLEIIRTLDPAGVGARDLRECLLLQIRLLKKTPEVINATKILTSHFNEFTNKHFQKIMTRMGISEVELKAAMAKILKLNPSPGGQIDDSYTDQAQQIVPDFVLEYHDGDLKLSMPRFSVPELRVNRKYADILIEAANSSERDKKEAAAFVKKKLDSAKWFVEAIKQRHNTLSSTMQAIVDYQREYFIDGDETNLKPMVLKDIAEKTGFDISTISRVVNSKYIETHFGIYSLKYFFSEGLENQDGEEVSTRELKKALQECVDTENKRKPLTDDELVERMTAKGYKVARRTIAKYRDQLGIPKARLRKEL